MIILRAAEVVMNFLPLRKQIIFTSFGGQYNDNPKYISIKMHEMRPDIKQIWIISSRCHEEELIPEYIQKVKINSFKATLKKCTSKILVDNGAGWVLVKSDKKIYGMLKRKKQFNISTWHGSPIKRIGADSLDSGDWNDKNMYSSSDILISGCEYVKTVFESAFLKKIPILLTGTPRNDILFSESKDIKINIRHKLHLDEDTFYLLFAPTYRNNPEDSGITQMNILNPVKLIQCFEKKFGGKWKIILRAHNVVLDKMNKIGLIDGNNIIDGNEFDDMAEYLVASDALISDFSGAIFDYALTNKPCFLFAHDREHYINAERGLYIELNKLPYCFAESEEDLLLSIMNYDEKEVERKRLEFLNYIGNVEQGDASERITNLIIERL